MKRSSEIFVRHFFTKYGDINKVLPIWMTGEIVSLGCTLNIYKGISNEIKRDVADNYKVPDKVLLSWLKTRNSFKEMLFYGQGRQTLSYGTARMMFLKYVEKAGLSHCGYTLHCLRHTFATDLLNAGMPLECLRILLGHSSLEVTRIYARLTDKTREQEYFAAMGRILKGDTDANYQCDY